jgi:hypothetical protein
VKKSDISYFLNGSGYGNVADVLIENDMDPNALRPFKGRDGRNYVAKIVGYNRRTQQPVYKKFVVNAPATLTTDAWKQLDRTVIRAAQNRLRVWTATPSLTGSVCRSSRLRR